MGSNVVLLSALRLLSGLRHIFNLFDLDTLYRPEVADGSAGRERLCRFGDPLRVDAEMAVEVGERAGLAEMLDTQRPRAMAVDGSQPGQRRRMAVEHADNAAMGR